MLRKQLFIVKLFRLDTRHFYNIVRFLRRSRMSYKVEKIVEPMTLAEGPHWNEEQQVLFFVNIFDHTIHMYDPDTGNTSKTKLGGRVGFIIPVEGKPGQFLVGEELRFLIIEWNGKEGAPATLVKELARVEGGDRINDGKADPRGRVFAGTASAETSEGTLERYQGALYRIDGDVVTKVESNVSGSNGLAWDLKEKAFYYTDTPERNIRRYDYDVETGDISNKRHIFDFEAHNITGLPDGTTIDSDGNLYIALFRGSGILNINPKTGEFLRKIEIPALQITSSTFGGPKLDVLFVTSTSFQWGEVKPTENCGSVFVVTGLGVRGLPNRKYKALN